MIKDQPYFEHILEAINEIENSLSGISRKNFELDKDKKDASIRRLEIIGEAVKNVSEETKKKYSEVEWKKIAGTRDRIIHSYFNVDLDVVWKIIRENLPVLKKQIERIKSS